MPLSGTASLSDQRLAATKRLVIIEIGAGTSIPSVRHFSEFQEGLLIRINPREADMPMDHQGISLAMPGLAALRRIRARLI